MPKCRQGLAQLLTPSQQPLHLRYRSGTRCGGADPGRARYLMEAYEARRGS